MSTWNVHMFIECSSCSYAYRNPKNTRNWFRYETFYYLFEFKERERHNFFLCWLFHVTPHHVRPPLQTTGLASASSENRLASSKLKSQLTVFFFSNSKILSPSLPRMTSFTFPVHFLSGVFIVTSVIVTSAPRARKHLHSMCAPN